MPMIRGGPVSYFISAGEYSGDLLGAELVMQLKKTFPDFCPFGLAGQAMSDVGVDVICSQERFAVMGILDVVKKLADLKQAEAFILAKIDERKPAFAILIDFPGLHFRLAEQLRMRGILVYQYCAPKVWAWGQKRVALLKRDFELVLGILPFEEAFFKKHGVRYHYVGSPHLDRIEKINISKTALGYSDATPMVALLPGSRIPELKLILPKLMQIKKRLSETNPDLKFVMPLAKNLTIDDIKAIVPNAALAECNGLCSLDGIDLYHGMSLELMAIADVAIVASGTATLECGLLGTPMVVVYVMDEASFDIAKSQVKVRYASLINLIADAPVLKEFIQKFDIDEVSAEVSLLLQKGERWQAMKEALQNIRDTLRPNAAACAARLIAQDLKHKGVSSD